MDEWMNISLVKSVTVYLPVIKAFHNTEHARYTARIYYSIFIAWTGLNTEELFICV